MPDAAQDLMELRKRAADLDHRRQLQIANQVASINRLLNLLQKPETTEETEKLNAAADEIVRLNEELSKAQHALAQVAPTE